MLESGQSIGKAKRHNTPLERSIVSTEGGFPFVPFVDPDKMVCMPEIDLSKESGLLESRYWGNGERGRVRTHSGAYRRTMVSWKTTKLHILQPKLKSPTWSWSIMGNQPWTFRRTLPQFFCNFIWFYSVLTSILFIFSSITSIYNIFFILRSQIFPYDLSHRSQACIQCIIDR